MSLKLSSRDVICQQTIEDPHCSIILLLIFGNIWRLEIFYSRDLRWNAWKFCRFMFYFATQHLIRLCLY
ncbi:hypothetical protein O6P43_008456 [Quillaja saponaria]|uniref:Uncharacterized protein n=1 Tax=Quillaja saponaria TaxID=32244 RepID=A0AAD7PWM9_QUISA|nr:hypothetical protein O6P43_008456 [Quillaja saponaria]